MLELRRVSLADPESDPTVPDEEVTHIPLVVNRGYVAIPTADVREYTKATALTFGAGVVVGMAVGAAFGNLLAKKGSR